MPALALFLAALYLIIGVAAALRTTGSSGIASVRSAPPMEAICGGMFAIATVLRRINPALALADVIKPWAELDTTPVHVAGFGLCAASILGNFEPTASRSPGQPRPQRAVRYAPTRPRDYRSSPHVGLPL